MGGFIYSNKLAHDVHMPGPNCISPLFFTDEVVHDRKVYHLGEFNLGGGNNNTSLLPTKEALVDTCRVTFNGAYFSIFLVQMIFGRACASLNITNTNFLCFLVHFLALSYLQYVFIDQDSISS